jgi:hypothetical protein
MNTLDLILIVIIIAIVYILVTKNTDMLHIRSEPKENFTNSQNFPYTNANQISDALDYGRIQDPGMYSRMPDKTLGPSSLTGVNQNSGKDIFDNRGYNWTANAKSPQVNEITAAADDRMLRQKFERTYMLDPDGSVAQYDPTYFEIDPNCCPAQYAPPFKLTDKNKTNADYAQNFVANQYSGMNYQDGYGCVCMTPKQADFYGMRGGNTD